MMAARLVRTNIEVALVSGLAGFCVAMVVPIVKGFLGILSSLGNGSFLADPNPVMGDMLAVAVELSLLCLAVGAAYLVVVRERRWGAQYKAQPRRRL